MKGIVYVLTNPAMLGIIKIGHTTRGDIKQRMNELFTTGVPVPFECVMACEVEDCKTVETALHIAFGPNRIHPKREFFKIEPEQPIAILKLFQRKEVTVEVNKEIDAVTSQEDRAAGDKLKRQRRPPLDFHIMGIPNGSMLFFNNGEDEKIAIVHTNRKVLYEGRECSLTQLTSEFLGLEYSIQPTPYWSFEGRSLSDIYNETYTDS
jgi:hypothetical protein